MVLASGVVLADHDDDDEQFPQRYAIHPYYTSNPTSAIPVVYSYNTPKYQQPRVWYVHYNKHYYDAPTRSRYSSNRFRYTSNSYRRSVTRNSRSNGFSIYY